MRLLNFALEGSEEEVSVCESESGDGFRRRWWVLLDGFASTCKDCGCSEGHGSGKVAGFGREVSGEGKGSMCGHRRGRRSRRVRQLAKVVRGGL